MEALSKIGEFFFDDGEEERMIAYEKYREKVLNNSTKNKTNAKPALKLREPSQPKLQKPTLEDDKVKKKVAPGSSKREKSTATGTTIHTSEPVSTTVSGTDSRSQDGSGSVENAPEVPETVCADLSLRSVSSRSVISESATGSNSASGDDFSGSGSRSSRKVRSGSRTSLGGVTEDGDECSVSSNGTDPTPRSENQLSIDNRVRFPNRKGRNRTRSLYNRFVGHGFKLGIRSGSTTTKHTLAATTETSGQRMTDQLMEYIDSGDEDNSSSEGSGSTGSSKGFNAHTRSSSLVHSRSTTSKSGRSASRGTMASKSHGTATSGGTSDFLSNRQTSQGSRNGSEILSMAATKATSLGGFHTGITQATSAATIKSDELTGRSMSTKSSTKKTVHGWVEGSTNKGATTGNTIELAIISDEAAPEPAPSSHTGNETIKKASQVPDILPPKLPKTTSGRPPRVPSLTGTQAQSRSSVLADDGTKVFKDAITHVREKSEKEEAVNQNLKESSQPFTTSTIVENPTCETPGTQSPTLSRINTQTNERRTKSQVSSVETESPTSQICNQSNHHNQVIMQELQAVNDGSILVTCSNSGVGMQFQDIITKESATHGDLLEFIEVTYDGPTETQDSPTSVPSAVSMTVSRECADNDEDEASASSASEDKATSPLADSSNVTGEQIEHCDDMAGEATEHLPPQPSSAQKKKGFLKGRFFHRKKKGKPKKADNGHHKGFPQETAAPHIHEDMSLNKEQVTRMESELSAATGPPHNPSDVTASDGFMLAIEGLHDQRGDKYNVELPSGNNQNKDHHTHVEDHAAKQESHHKGPLTLFAAKVRQSGATPAGEPDHSHFFQAGQVGTDVVEEKEASSSTPWRKNKWVRSFSFSRKKRNERMMKKGKDGDPNGLHMPANKVPQTEGPQIESRVPSTLPMPRRMRAEDDSKTDVQAQTPTVASGTVARNSNPWPVGDSRDDDDDVMEYNRGHPDHLDRDAIDMQDDCAGSCHQQNEMMPPDSPQKSVTFGTKLSKKGLKKLRSGVKGILRRKGEPRHVKNPSENLAAEDEPKLEQETGTNTSQQGVDNTSLMQQSQEVVNNAFLMQHQMMMQSRNPQWKQPVGVREVPQQKQCNQLDTTKAGVGKNHTGNKGQPCQMDPCSNNETSHQQLAQVDDPKNQRSMKREKKKEGLTKLQRVLGEREKVKKQSRHCDSTTDSFLDSCVAKAKMEKHLMKEMIKTLPSTSSHDDDPSDDESEDYTYDDTNADDASTTDGTMGAGETMDGTVDATVDPTVDETVGTPAYSVHNQRVLDTLRLLHAVKRKKKRQVREMKREIEVARINRAIKQHMRHDLDRQELDCNKLDGIIVPFIDGLDETGCGIRMPR